MNDAKRYLSVTEIANHLDVHRSTIIRSIKEGRIQALRIGSSKKSIYRIPYTELERLIKGIELNS